MTTQSLFSNLNAQPAPYNPQALLPNPQAGQNALASALAQQKKRQQDASLAASALARKSHPQTLGQPPKSNASPQQGQPGIGPTPPQAGVNAPIQRQPDPGLPRAVGGSAPPPPGQLGAAQAGGPTPALSPANQLTALQKQISDTQAQENQQLSALQSAMAQPQPTMPTYTAPTMQPQNPGMAIGAALAALFAPKYSQGAIGALGVDQANREKAYDQATTAAKDKWNAGLSSYEDTEKAREDKIGDAEKLATATGNRLKGLDTSYNTLQNDLLRDQEAKDRLQATEAYRNQKHSEFMATRSDRQAYRDKLYDHWGDQLGLRREQLKIQKSRLDLGWESLRDRMKNFGYNEDQIAKIASLRAVTALVIEHNREVSASGRQQDSAAARVVLQGKQALDNLQLAVLRAPNPAAAATAMKNLAAYYTSPRGLQHEAAIKQFGVNPDEATDVLDSMSGADQPTDGSTPSPEASPAAPAGSGVTINIGQGQGGAVGGPSGTGMSVSDMLAAVRGGGGGAIIDKGGNVGGESGAGGGIDKTALAHNTSSYQSALAYYHDPNKAWSAIRDTVINNIQAAGGTADAKTVEAYRRAIMKGGSQTRGGSQGKNLPAPARGNPLAQALGVSPALLGQ
jgi:hypothetical protein